MEKENIKINNCLPGWNRVELSMEARNEVEEEIGSELNRYVEMREVEHGFITGLLKANSPRKVLEVGVASGGTTSVILKCLENIGQQSEMFSVDISSKWYRDACKETGFLVNRMGNIGENIQHKFLLGNSIPYYIDEIGREIDFLLLDTTHCLPGELLDFLVCFPYLKDGCVVVLHDVAENILTGNPLENATKLLFDIVKAEKYYMLDVDKYPCGISNIAAFRIDAETRNCIGDIFSALANPWLYFWASEEEEKYLDVLGQNYRAEYVDYLKKMINMQKHFASEKIVEKHYGNGLMTLRTKWEKQEKVYLYGAGYYAQHYLNYAREHKLPIDGIVISDDQKIVNRKCEGINIYKISELEDSDKNAFFVLALDRRYWEIVILNLKYRGFYNIF